MRETIEQLGRLRGRSRTLLYLQRISLLVAFVLAAVLALGALDWLLRFPAAFRLVLLLGGLVALGWFVVRDIAPLLRFNPTLTDVALRIERTIPALEGRLASSVEFASSGAGDRNALAARALRDTESRIAGADIRSVINPSRTRRDVAILGVVFAVAVLIVAISPASAATGAKRILLPLSGAQWPARTAVASLMEQIEVHPRGTALALRAQGVKAPGGAVESMDIRAHYRLGDAEGQGAWREVILTHQADARYERLVDTDAQSIQFYFESDDSQTQMQTIVLEPPPAVERATLSLTPPGYAEQHISPVQLELGSGLDERAITESPALAGSSGVLRFEFNKPLPAPEEGAAREAWLRESLGWPHEAMPEITVDGAETEFVEARWTLTETTVLSFNLTDAYGLHNVDDIAYRIDVVEDRAPSITMTDPQSDRAVLNSAVVPLSADARDDVAIAGIGLEAHKVIEPTAGTTERMWRQWDDASDASVAIIRELDLARYELVEGDVIEVSGITADNYYLNGEEHPQVRSAVRRLRIISERDFGEMVLRELKALRENAIRIRGQQAELQDDVIDDGVQPGVSNAQERIGERLNEQLESLDDLRERTEFNRFQNEALQEMLRQAEDLLRHAGQASNEAGGAIEAREREASQQERQAGEQSGEEQQQGRQGARSGEQQPPQGEAQEGAQEDQQQPRQGEPQQQDDPADATEPDQREQADTPEIELREPAEEDREIVEHQQDVLDELRDLIESLDRNEDSWVMQEQIKDLLQQQSQLQADTQGMSNQTRGQPLEELTPQELSELDRIRQRQEELAQEMRELTDELRDRADELESVDPQAAEAQRQAAETAEQREVDRDMENAAQSVSENQLQNAQNSQQRARDSLQQMLEDMNRKRAQAEELHRRLLSLIESIKRLVTVQESEINELARAKFDDDFSGRDRAMIRLNQNTQVVSDEARAAGNETARVARSLDRAADAQSATVGYLRASPIAADDADGAERRSLELLREALQLAEELEEQTEEEIMEQRREELLTRYRELAEREVALRGETAELQQVPELGRRELVEARKQSNLQDDIRIALEDIRSATEEVSDSLIFNHVHNLIDAWANEVIDALREGDVSVSVTDRQQAIAESIGRLVQALEEEMQPPDEFEDQGQQQGGGGGQGGSQPQPLVPPIAELKLLRGVQEHIYDRTRDLDGRSDLDDAARRQRLRELGREQADLQDLGTQMLEALEDQGAPGQTPPDGPPEGAPQE